MYNYPYTVPSFLPQPQPQSQPQQYFANGVRWVKGLDEVKSVYVPLGECAMFMDQNEPLFYVKRTDAYGISTINVARFELVDDTPKTSQQPDVDSLEDRMKELEDKYESLVQKLGSTDQPKQPVLCHSQSESKVPKTTDDGLSPQVDS